MNSKDWLDMARVFRAGALSYDQWSPSTGNDIHVSALTAQADMCEAISREHAAQERRDRTEKAHGTTSQ